ncbi:hypothetical protein [Streptomyces sp. NPDC002853]
MNVWSIAMAEHHDQNMLSGIIPAAFSTGSFLGGLIYGSRTWNDTTTRRLIIATGAFLTGWLPLLALPGPYAAIAAVTVPGAFLSIVVACAYVTTSALTPAGRTAEAYAWLILAIGARQSAGAALAGRLPKLRTPEAAGRWTWLLVVAHTQLRLPRPLAARTSTGPGRSRDGHPRPGRPVSVSCTRLRVYLLAP